jgi:hypothetical protein
MGTVLVRFVTLLVVWTALSAGITWILKSYGDMENWLTPFVALMAVGVALSAGTAFLLAYVERHCL